MKKTTNLSVVSLEKLSYWLNYEVSSGVLFLFSWFSSILVILTAIIALVFIPFMLKTLY